MEGEREKGGEGRGAGREERVGEEKDNYKMLT